MSRAEFNQFLERQHEKHHPLIDGLHPPADIAEETGGFIFMSGEDKDAFISEYKKSVMAIAGKVALARAREELQKPTTL